MRAARASSRPFAAAAARAAPAVSPVAWSARAKASRIDALEELVRHVQPPLVYQLNDGGRDEDDPVGRVRSSHRHVEDRRERLVERVALAHPGGGGDGDAQGEAPGRGVLRQRGERALRMRARLGVVAAPRVRVRQGELQLAARARVRVRGERALGDPDDSVQIVRPVRLLDGAAPVGDRAPRVAAAFEVGREHGRVGLAVVFQETRRRRVARGAILGGQHRVGDVGHDRVAEGVLALAGDPGVRPRHDELGVGEPVDLGLDVRAADERRHATLPEPPAEDGRRAQRPAGLVGLDLDARLERGGHARR